MGSDTGYDTGKMHTEIMEELEQKALWLSAWIVHNANHIRPSTDGLKVGQ